MAQQPEYKIPASLEASIFIAIISWIIYGFFPKPFPDRLARIPKNATHIDNVRPYDSAEKWSPDGSQAGLHLMNPQRVEYFDQTIRGLLKPPLKILDVGCGGGLVTTALANMEGYSAEEASFEGVDLSLEALKYATRQAEEGLLTNVRFQNGSVYSLPFEDQSFDVVIASDVLEHFLDLVEALKEMARVLKPNGILLFDTINRSWMALWVAIVGAEHVVKIVPKGTHDWSLFIKPEELDQALEAAGFEQSNHISFDPSFQALKDLTLFNFGMMQAEDMKGTWITGPPSSSMVSYIGHAIRRDE